MDLVKVSKLASGTYGQVYLTVKNDQYFAVKRNFKFKKISWLGNIKELDILNRLKEHPFIVKMINFTFGKPFNEDLDNLEDSDYFTSDNLYFVLEYCQYNVSQLIRNCNNLIMDLRKKFMIQLCLGLEYIHSQGITHRDLSCTNILIQEKNGDYNVKICDFGMSQFLTDNEGSMGVTTSWYRAPEICMELKNYTSAIDIWSLGCILFEIVTGKAYIEEEDNNLKILQKIIKKSQNVVHDKTYIMTKFKSYKKLKFDPVTPKLINQLSLTETFLQDFNSTPGNIDEYIDLLEKIFVVNSEERIKISNIVDHNFFDRYKLNIIKSTRTTHNPEPNPLYVLNLENSIERKIAINIAKNIYDNKKLYSWYTHRILFQGMDLYDRYLEYKSKNCNSIYSIDPFYKSEDGCILTFTTCLYISYKYFLAFEKQLSWMLFAPSQYANSVYETICENFEKFLIFDVCSTGIYRDTLYDVVKQLKMEINDHLVDKLFKGYCQTETWNKKSVRSLCRNILEAKPTSVFMKVN